MFAALYNAKQKTENRRDDPMNRKKTALLLSFLIAFGAVSACSQKPSETESTIESAASIETSAVSDEVTESSEETSTAKSTAPIEQSKTQNSAGASSSVKPESSAEKNTSDTSENSSSQTSSETSKNNPSSSASQTETSKNSPAVSSVPTTESSVSETTAPEEPSKAPEPSTVQELSKTEESSIASQVSQNTVSEPTKPVAEPAVSDIGGEALYGRLFDLNNKVTVELQVDKSELDKLQSDYYKYERIGSKSPIYRKASLKVNVGGTVYTIDEVGIRLKGNMSLKPVYAEDGRLNLTHYKLSFNETFDDKDRYGAEAKAWTDEAARKARKNRRFATLKEMDIKWNQSYDETYIRELYAAELCREEGVLAQHINLSQLTFNGSNYGVVKIYETVDEIFLQKNLPESALGGDLYKCGWTFKPCNYVKNEVTYGVEDKEKGKKYNFNLKTNKKTSDHSSLKNLLQILSQNPTKTDLEKAVDMPYFAKFMAMSYFLGDPDDIRNNYNNHYVYFRKDNGKVIFIVYDNDRTLGVTYGYNPEGTGMTAQSPFSSIAAGAGGMQKNPLIKAAILNQNACLKTEYTAALKKIAASDRWNTDVFNRYYETACNHFASVVTPDIQFANVKKTFRFSLNGIYPSGEKANMSFSEYVTRIMKTYHTAVGE